MSNYKDVKGRDLEVGDLVLYTVPSGMRAGRERNQVLAKIYKIEGFNRPSWAFDAEVSSIVEFQGKPFRGALTSRNFLKFPSQLPHTLDSINTYAKLEGYKPYGVA